MALDLEDEFKIKEVVGALWPKGVKFKIGSIAFTKFGPNLVKGFIDQGIDIFLDLKLYDTPNTMARAAAIIAELGCWAFTVHLPAGPEALGAVKQAVAKTVQELGRTEPLILGVSVLTSSVASFDEVNSLIRQADLAGLSGVIASANEVKAIKQIFPGLKVITPGIRRPGDIAGGQKRIATAGEAIAAGADYIVVGRPIIEKGDYLKAAEDILSI